MAKIDAYTLSDGITLKFRARPSGINPADGRCWPNRSFDTWADADRYQRIPSLVHVIDFGKHGNGMRTAVENRAHVVEQSAP